MASGETDPDATKYCSNCKRDIPSLNYLMHQNHCSRNIVLCSQCEEPVPRTEMDKHNDEYHAKVTCKCGEAVEKCKQEEHDAELCPQRQVTCEYCEMEMDHKDLAEHTDFCGSRTDPCPLCSRYIFFRDRARHNATNCKYPEVKANPVESSAPRDQRRRNEHLFQAAEPSRLPPRLLEHFSHPPFHRQGMEEQSDLLAREMRRNVSDGIAGDRKHRKNQDRVQNVVSRNQTRAMEKNEERALLQSAVNHEEADHRLAQHLAHDLPYDSSFSPRPSVGHSYTDSGLPPYSDYQDDLALQEILKASYNIPAVNTFQEPSSALDDVTLPCEFCQQPIPAANLIQHQSGCQPYITSYPRPENLRANNSRPRAPGQTQPPPEVLNNLSHGRALPGYGSLCQPDSSVDDRDTDSPLMLPCEFCEDLLPSDVLPMHQVNCAENRTVTPAPATFDTGPGSYPLRRGGSAESPIRPMPQRVQRPQDFPNQPKKYQEGPDPSIDDDDYEVDAVPVRMSKPRHPPQLKSHQPGNPVLAAVFPIGTSQQDTGQQPTIPRSASEKYLRNTSRAPRQTPTVTTGGAVRKPKTKNTAVSGQARYHEERPQSKSSARVQETLQGLRDVPANLHSDEELNNQPGTRLTTRLVGEGDSYTQINNGSQYHPKKTNFPPSGYNLSDSEGNDEPALLSQFNPPSGPGKPHQQQGARQKVRKSNSKNRGMGHADVYTPSFPGTGQRKGGDAERRGNSGGQRRSKQPSAPTTVTFDPDGPAPPPQAKEGLSAYRMSSQKQGQQKRRTAPLQNARFRDDPML